MKFVVIGVAWFLFWLHIGLKVTGYLDGTNLLNDEPLFCQAFIYPYGPHEEDEEYFLYVTAYSFFNPKTQMSFGGEKISGQAFAALLTTACSGGRGRTLRHAVVDASGNAVVLMNDFSVCTADVSGPDFEVFKEEMLANHDTP